MITREITSLQHPIVKHLMQLRSDRSYRQNYKQVLIAGSKLVSEIAKKYPAHTLIVEKNSPQPSLKAQECLIVTPSILKKVTGLEAPEPYAALVQLPENQSLGKKKLILVLDGISDPGNLGTLIRTALAFGWEGIFLTPGTCDPFNDKAIRSAKGASFFVPLYQGTEQELVELIEKNHLRAYVADAKVESVENEKISSPLALILGNEAKGASDRLKKKYTLLSLPISHIDSLNVAIAGAILMYLFQRRGI